MANEKKYQDEFHDILAQYGFVLKNQDLVVCPVCKSKVHPKNTGIPDYLLINKEGLSSFIECKGGTDRINFSQIEAHQWEYSDYIERITGRSTWFLFVTGTQSVTNKTPMRRRMWLVPAFIVKDTFNEIKTKTGYKYIAVHDKVGHMKKYPELAMESIWKEFELKRITGNWIIPESNMLYQEIL